MELIVCIILAFGFSILTKDNTSNSNNRTKSKGLSNYEKFDMFNRFNKK